MYFFPRLGSVVGGTNARTELNLLNVTTSQPIQPVSAYQAGELTGWVTISATTPRRFYLAAQFSQNGAGTNYNISYQTSGDVPPTGFAVTITSGGTIELTLTSSPLAGFTSAKINFALNAPAVGATFPLAVDASTITTGVVASARLPQVSSSGQGAFPSLTSSLDNATATQLGLKQYLHGTIYNGGNSPTVTSAQSGFAVARAAFVPYQMQDNTWRLKFNAAGTFTSATVTSVIISISGVTWNDVSVYSQSVCGIFLTNANSTKSFCSPNTGDITVQIAVSSTANGIVISGDVELKSKPTWAY